MRILFISGVLPHAKVTSGSIIVHNRIRLLAERGYDVGLATFVSAGDEAHIPDLKPMLYEVEWLPAPGPASALSRFLSYSGCGPPMMFRQAYSPDMQRLVGKMVERSHYDVVIAEFSVMGQYLCRNPHLPATRRVISCHSGLAAAYRRALDLQRWSFRAVHKRFELRRLQEYEFSAYRSADLLLVLTPEERMDILRYAPNARIAVVPYGVDVDHFRPDPAAQGSEESIVFTGVYSDEANRDAVMWFARTVWPELARRHPGLTWRVIGPDPTAEMREMAARDRRIIIAGKVDDVMPHLVRTRVYVCPMRMGAGFRGKILQAMAAGAPVVSTTLAAEGIPAQTGENIMLADTPHVIAESVNLLLDDPGLRTSIARNAREMVVNRFSWPHCVDLLENTVREIAGQPVGGCRRETG